MSTRTILVTAVAIATLVIPSVAGAATIRVTSAKKPLLENREWRSGSTRAYLDTRRVPHRLKRRTALGQLLAATARDSRGVAITQFSFGPFVSRIGPERVGAKGSWMLFVNGRPAQVGANQVILRRTDRVIWLLDTNYARKGPYVLDLQLTANADGTVTAEVEKIGGTKPVAAAGAAIVVDGATVATTGTDGTATFTPSGSWANAQATLRGSIASQLVAG